MVQFRASAAERAMQVSGRFTRAVVAFFLMVVTALTWALVTPTQAYAADDQIDSFTINYDMQPSGVLKVKETIVWRFGSNSGRHGIQRDLVIREPDPDSDQDFVYGISNINVTSPDDYVATEFSSKTTESQGGREEELNVRIGDPDQTISAPTATYVISYDVTGAMRSFSGYDEFFWDGPGFGNPLIKELTITTTVPGGTQDATCFTGPPGSTTPCETKKFTKGGEATFAQTNVPPGQSVSIGVKITPGLVADNKPHMEPNGSKLSPAERVGAIALAAVTLLITVGSPIVGVLWWRKNGRDQRYADLAPGTVPYPGQEVRVVPNDPDIPIPVAFSPPPIPVAEAGLLIDGQVDSRETAATIIDLAVRGALTVQSYGKDDFQVTLVDPNRATAPHEMVLLTNLFDGEPPGAVKDLSAPGSLASAHEQMRDSVRNQVASRGWFRKVPSAAATSSFGFGVIVIAIFASFAVGFWLLLLLLPLLPIVITLAVIRRKLKRGQRTAEGRAVCDQIEGFRTYIATAEADQLKFEEGEDIFSKYLPWAIIFELADRWAKICGDLVAMGRLPNETPYWYIGNYQMAAFNTSFLTSSLTSAATPVASSSGAGGTGFGGGSSFGGGGFSGGGGGGGGSGSW
ncbi:MAG TPA: DUF2207 domain-containing protein [Propionibacteriaceae bacterium]|jgi:uncharacterized protein (TIGR04222 family)|nr:DUF2207 domain-containing protein [Propionibacteriaceae bacterium]